MAGRTITQRIQLVGGDEIKVKLDNIGKAGEVAFTRLSAAANSSSPFAKFGAALERVKTRIEAVRTAGEKVGSNFERLGERLGAVGERLGIVAGVTIFEAGRKLLEVAKGAGEAQENLDNSAAAIGTSAKALDEFQKIANLSGVSSEGFTKALLKLNAAANDSAKSDIVMSAKKRELVKQLQLGKITFFEYQAELKKLNDSTEASTVAFDRLGVSVKNADGTQKDSLDLFREVGAALGEIDDGAKRSGLAMELFGAKNAKLLTLSTMNVEEFKKQREEIQRLTPALQDAEREGLANFGDRLELLGKVVETTRDKLLALFAPSFTRIVNAIIERVAAFRADILGTATDLEARFKPVVDDIVAAIQGRDADVKNASILRFRDAALQAASDIVNAVRGIAAAFQVLLTVLDTVATAINEVFGTKLTGGEILAAAALLKLTGLFGVITTAASTLISVIGLVVAAFGAVPVIIAAVGFALGFLITKYLLQLGPVLSQVAAWFTETWEGVKARTAALWAAITGAFSSGVAAIVGVFTGVVDSIAAVWQAIVDGAIATWDAILQAAQDLGNGIADAIKAGIDAALGYAKSLYDSIVGYFEGIIRKAKAVASAIADAVGLGGGGGGDVQSNARGGYIRGPGTGTSDSILSWLSNGEFVVRAAAVKKFGVGFFQALNALREPGGFATGGIVQAAASAMLPPIPRFAAGGLVAVGAGGSGGGRPFTLQIGGEEFTGLTATDDAVNKLQRYATGKQIRSAGRKPNWYRG